MAADGRHAGNGVGYDIERGLIGALVTYGPLALTVMRAEGWHPSHCRRPQHAALAAWLVEGIDDGSIADLPTAIAQLELRPPPREAADQAVTTLCNAPAIAPIMEAIPASVRSAIDAWRADRLAELQAQIRVAAAAGDMAGVAAAAKKIADLAAPPRPARAKAQQATDPGDTRRDPAAMAALKALSKQGRDDDRLRARAVLTADPRWAGKCWYDAMRGRQMRGDRVWADHEDHDAALWLSEIYGVRISSGACREVLAGIAQSNRRHPLQDWLGGVRWDGEARAEQWLQRGLGVDDSPLVRAIGRRWLIQAAARAMRPGCQADATLVLVGEQGRYKSSVIRALAGSEFFSESPIDLHGDVSDVVSLVHSAWIHDMSEGTDVRRADVDRLKQFLTTRTDLTRRKYARTHEERPRSCVFVVTTNDNRFIPSDPSGARRFWPVTCRQGDVPWIEANRDQLWAEAMVLLGSGEQWHLTDEERGLLLEHQADYEQDDAIRGRVRRWLREAETGVRFWTAGERAGREPITTEAVMTGPMGLDIKEVSKRQNEMRAGDTLRKLGFIRRRVRLGKELDWAYVPGGTQDET